MDLLLYFWPGIAIFVQFQLNNIVRRISWLLNKARVIERDVKGVSRIHEHAHPNKCLTNPATFSS